jgi:hypothetical protein
MDARTVSLCRWLNGPSKGQWVIQDAEAVEDGEFTLHDLDGEQLSHGPNAMWEIVQDLGHYSEGQDGTDGFWAAIAGVEKVVARYDD